MDISAKMPSLKDKIIAKAEPKTEVKPKKGKKSKVAKLGKKKGKK